MNQQFKAPIKFSVDENGASVKVFYPTITNTTECKIKTLKK
jgi:hypothetical protein